MGDVSFGPRPCEEVKDGIVISKHFIKYFQVPSIGVYGNVAFFREWIDATMSRYGKPGLCSAN